MIGRFGIAMSVALLSCLADAGRAAEPGLPPAMVGSWRMTKLVCATCAPTGRLPADLAGGVIHIGPASFDDPLAGACPEPHFAQAPRQTLAAFLEQTANAASLRRLAPSDETVIPVAVVCKPPPHARKPIGATVSLAFIGRTTLVRRWEDGSTIVLRRAAPPTADDGATPKN